MAIDSNAVEIETSERSPDSESLVGDSDQQEIDTLEDEAEQDTEQDTEQGDSSSTKRLALNARISSLLFVAVKPLSVEQLAEASGARAERVEKALEEICDYFVDEIHGFSLKNAAGKWQLRTTCAASTYIHRLIPKTARKLSKAAAETLAVIAYKQPVQRAEIEAIRGVDALPTLKTLIDAKLIRIVGREQTAGQPALYGTTNTFLEKFGLSDLSQLPSAKELSQFLDEPGDVVEGVEEFSEQIEMDVVHEDQDSLPVNGVQDHGLQSTNIEPQ